MPKGELQAGKRRGRYAKTPTVIDESMSTQVLARATAALREASMAHGAVIMGAPCAPDPWSDSDRELYAALVADSPLVSVVTRQTLARTVVEADRQCRALDAMTSRSADDDANLTRSQTSKRKALEQLQVAVRLRDDGEEP